MTSIFEKNVLLTGVSDAIGYATARALSNEGAVIVGIDISKKKLDEAHFKISSYGGEFFGFQFDLKQIIKLSYLVDSIVRKVGDIHNLN